MTSSATRVRAVACGAISVACACLNPRERTAESIEQDSHAEIASSAAMPAAAPSGAVSPSEAATPTSTITSSALETQTDAQLMAAWAQSPWCLAAADDVRPPECKDPAGCYKLDLLDLVVDVTKVRGGGLTTDAANQHYQAAWPIKARTNELKACFAFEIDRGRPPSGELKIELAGKSRGCSERRAKVLERNVGLKTASCVRDVVKRYRLPGDRGEVTLEVAVSVTGI